MVYLVFHNYAVRERNIVPISGLNIRASCGLVRYCVIFVSALNGICIISRRSDQGALGASWIPITDLKVGYWTYFLIHSQVIAIVGPEYRVKNLVAHSRDGSFAFQ